MIDHINTAKELERTAQVITNMADNIGSVGAYQEAEAQKEHLIQIANWHRDRGEEQQRNLNLCELAHHGQGVFGTIIHNGVQSAS